MRIKSEFEGYRGFIFDLDGTIYLGERLIEGAAEAVRALRAAGKGVVFLSNKPLERREAYARKLARLGIPATEEDVINSAYVLGLYLARSGVGRRVYATGEPPLLEELRAHGLEVLTEQEARRGPVDAVIASFDRTLSYVKLQAAFEALKRGARFLATNADRTCPVDGGELPDAAGVIAFLEATTGRRVELVAGKPHAMMLSAATARLGLKPQECLMVGDRLETDVVMGVNAGMATAAVLTGVSSREDVAAFRARHPGAPTYVLESVASLCEPVA